MSAQKPAMGGVGAQTDKCFGTLSLFVFLLITLIILRLHPAAQSGICGDLRQSPGTGQAQTGLTSSEMKPDLVT